MISFFDEKCLLDFFRNSVANDKLYHTSLFVGPADLEKTALAVNVASLLLCKSDVHLRPCRDCSSCNKIREHSHPDLLLVARDQKKSIAIAQIREVIYEASIKPWEGRYKIFILPQIDALREEAANALLKTLEEPLEHCLFILTAENENGILPTVLSRCQIFPLRCDQQVVIKTLINQHNIAPAIAQAAARFSDGGVNAALATIKSKWSNRARLLANIINNVDPLTVASEIVEICGNGEQGRQNAEEWIDYLASFWHDALIYHYLPFEQANVFLINKDLAPALQRLAGDNTITAIHKQLQELFHSRRLLNYNINLGLLWENIFIGSTPPRSQR